MRLPTELWSESKDLILVESLVVAFSEHPLILADSLGNSVYLNEKVEELFGERADALVNRLLLSLLGFDERQSQRIPKGLLPALLEGAAPWRGVVTLGLPAKPQPYFAEVSSIRKEGRLLCGVVRLSTRDAWAGAGRSTPSIQGADS